MKLAKVVLAQVALAQAAPVAVELVLAAPAPAAAKKKKLDPVAQDKVALAQAALVPAAMTTKSLKLDPVAQDKAAPAQAAPETTVAMKKTPPEAVALAKAGTAGPALKAVARPKLPDLSRRFGTRS